MGVEAICGWMQLLPGSEEDGVDGGWEGNSGKQTKKGHQRSEVSRKKLDRGS